MLNPQAKIITHFILRLASLGVPQHFSNLGKLPRKIIACIHPRYQGPQSFLQNLMKTRQLHCNCNGGIPEPFKHT